MIDDTGFPQKGREATAATSGNSDEPCVSAPSAQALVLGVLIQLQVGDV